MWATRGHSGRGGAAAISAAALLLIALCASSAGAASDAPTARTITAAIDRGGKLDPAELRVPSGVSAKLLDGPGEGEVRVSILLRSQPVLEAASPRDIAALSHGPTPGSVESLERRRAEEIRSLAPAVGAAERAQAPIADAIEAAGGTVRSASSLPSSLVTSLPRDRLEDLAARDDVQAIAPAPSIRPLLDVAAESVGATDWWAQGHRGGTGPADPIEADVSMYLDYPDPGHPAFAGVQLDQQVNPDGPKSVGHGTTTASEIASSDSTYRGLAYGVERVISGNLDYSFGLTSNGETTADPAEVINFSFGSNDDERGQQVDAALSTFGASMSAGAGNGGSTSRVDGIAGGRNTIAVGALYSQNTVDSSDDTVWESSSPGPTDDGRKKPDLVAPTPEYTANSNWDLPGQPEWSSGGPSTSVAAPIVSSGALLLWGSGIADPNAQKAILINSARDGRSAADQPMDTQTGWQPDWGWGEVDLAKALAERTNYVAHGVEGGGDRLYRANVAAAADKATLTWRLRGTYTGDADPHLAYTVTNLDLRQYRAADGTEVLPPDNPNGAGPDAIDPNDTVEQVRAPAAGQTIYKVEAASTVEGAEAEPFALAAEAPLSEVAPPAVELVEVSVAPSGTLACGDPVEVSAKLRNPTADLAALGAELRLDHPAGVELVSAPATQTVSDGTLGPNETSVAHVWTVRATSDGDKQLSLTGSSESFGEPSADSGNVGFTASCPAPPSRDGDDDPGGSSGTDGGASPSPAPGTGDSQTEPPIGGGWIVAPRLEIDRDDVTIRKRRKLKIGLSCGPSAHCAGVLRLLGVRAKAKRSGKRRVLARKRLSLKPASSTTVRLRLRRKRARRLCRKGRVALVAEANLERSGGGSARERLPRRVGRRVCRAATR